MIKRILKYKNTKSEKSSQSYQAGGSVGFISGTVQYDKSKDADYIQGQKIKAARVKAEALKAKNAAAKQKAEAANQKEITKNLLELDFIDGGIPELDAILNAEVQAAGNTWNSNFLNAGLASLNTKKGINN